MLSRRIPDLPQRVREAIEQTPPPPAPADKAMTPDSVLEAFTPLPMEITQQLREASTEVASGEPSWSCLAYLLEEEQFLQVWQYLGPECAVTLNGP